MTIGASTLVGDCDGEVVHSFPSGLMSASLLGCALDRLVACLCVVSTGGTGSRTADSAQSRCMKWSRLALMGCLVRMDGSGWLGTDSVSSKLLRAGSDTVAWYTALFAKMIEPLTLRSGAKMPAVGLGTWKIPREACRETVLEAIRTGYRHMDCACDCKHHCRTCVCHLSCLQTRCRRGATRPAEKRLTVTRMCADGNEAEVGEGINEAITLGLVTRAELWVTSKLWNTYHAAEHVEAAARRSLADLQLEYFDLYLVHFPIALKSVPCPSAPRPRLHTGSTMWRYRLWRDGLWRYERWPYELCRD